MEHSARYIVLFAAAVCGVCSIVVAGTAVSLKERQDRNAALDVQSKVLVLAGIAEEGALSDEEIESLYEARIEPRIIDMKSGQYTDTATDGWDQMARMKDTETSTAVADNPARVRRVPNESVVYHIKAEDGSVDSVIVPVQGQGLWGPLHGYFAVQNDGQTVKGITFYFHKETPGLGAEVDNPRWKALWPGRKIYDDEGQVAIQVKKGTAGSVADDPYQVDGLSGATITSRGVTNTLAFWMGDQGFGPYMSQLKNAGSN